jgi:predicted HicB family RNase H-like nuclease
MTKADPELRTITLNLRTTPSVKKMVQALADAEERSIAQTVERLIRAEVERRGLTEPTTGKKKTRP